MATKRAKATKPAKSGAKHRFDAPVRRAAAPRKALPKDRALPGMESARHSDLDDLCHSIAECRETINALSGDEKGYKESALDYMKTHLVSVYKASGVELSLVPGHDVLRVRLVKDGATVQTAAEQSVGYQTEG